MVLLRAQWPIEHQRRGDRRLSCWFSAVPVRSLQKYRVATAVLVAIAGLAVSAAVAAEITTGARANVRRTALAKYHRPESIPFPEDNSFSESRADLGRMLFFDPRLSGSNWISCATCHNPGLSWGDGLPRAIGHGMQVLGRKTPTILNAAWMDLLFWDGRAATLEEQALGPIAAAGEMNQDLAGMVVEILAVPGYRTYFEKAYPGEPIDERTVAKAIATYERTIVSAEAPFDRWVAGDETAVSESAKRGFDLFEGKAVCAKCHSGWSFTDGGFHDIGVGGDDIGRSSQLPTIEAMVHAFKTPTLRDCDRRAPFMHDGSEPTLEAVIELYNVGGRVRRPSLSNEIRPLLLSPGEKQDLVAFLKTLTGGSAPVTVPVLPVN